MRKYESMFYTIDFFKDDEFVKGYFYTCSSPKAALTLAKKELSLDEYDADYYVIYSMCNVYSEEGWL